MSKILFILKSKQLFTKKKLIQDWISVEINYLNNKVIFWDKNSKVGTLLVSYNLEEKFSNLVHSTVVFLGILGFLSAVWPYRVHYSSNNHKSNGSLLNIWFINVKKTPDKLSPRLSLNSPITSNPCIFRKLLTVWPETFNNNYHLRP